MPPLAVRSLYLKVVIPIVALVLAGMVGVSYFAMRAMGEGVKEAAAQRARYWLTYVRTAVEDVRDQDMVDRNHLQTSLERLRVSPDVEAARVLSASGRVLYSSLPAEIGQTMPIPAAPGTPAGTADRLGVVSGRPDLLRATGSIANHPRCSTCHGTERAVLAFADVDISLSRQSAGMRTWGRLATAAALAQFAIIGIGIALVLGFIVVRPIRRLSASMSQVQHGNLEVTALPAGTRELDTLVEGFNDMVTRLRRARQVEQEAQRSHLARVEQLATLGEVAASLAHEIRNPLAGTKAAVDVLASEEKAEEPRRILRHISGELARVDGVVRQLLNFARPKAPVLAKAELQKLIDDAVMLSGPRAAAQGVTLEVQRGSAPLAVLADADMVRQVIVNLVINALQALDGVAGATVVLALSVREEHALCTVRDNGPGVPADRADAIFRPFVTTKPHGTGLGLATSRRLIELHGGRLWLENPGAPGACFAFTLPLFAGPEPDRT